VNVLPEPVSYAEQHLVAQAVLQPFHQFFDRLQLVTLQLEIGHKLEPVRH